MKKRYFAQSAGGFINSRLSDVPLDYAVDFDANYCDGATWKIWGFFLSLEEAKNAVVRTALPDEAFSDKERGHHVAGVLHRNTKGGDILVRRGGVVCAFLNRDEPHAGMAMTKNRHHRPLPGVEERQHETGRRP